MPPVFYVLVLLICLLIGAFIVVGAIVDPNIVLMGIAVLVAAPLAGMLIRDVVAGELFNPLVAAISTAVIVPVLAFPPHAVATVLLSLWGILVVALAGKTAWGWVGCLAPGPEAHASGGGQTLE